MADEKPAAARRPEKRDFGLGRRVLARLNADLGGGGVRFLEIGANDGILADPVVKLALQHDWSGVVVEPVPLYFEQLCHTYRDCPRIECLNLAIDAVESERPIYFVKDVLVERQRAREGDYWLQGIASFFPGHLRKHGVEDCDFEAVVVKTVRGQTLVDRMGLLECDALIVDVEGAEREVLASFDFTRWRPRCVLFESEFFGVDERRFVEQLLVPCGYQLWWDRPDSYATRLEWRVDCRR